MPPPENQMKPTDPLHPGDALVFLIAIAAFVFPFLF
jgi:hypothetical protein